MKNLFFKPQTILGNNLIKYWYFNVLNAQLQSQESKYYNWMFNIDETLKTATHISESGSP